MKIKILIAGLVCLIFVISIVNAQAYRETDRFTGKTTIYSTKRRITLVRAQALYFFTPAPKDESNELSSLVITGCHQEWGQRHWKYLENHDLIFLADGESIIIDKTEHEGDLDIFGNGKIGELVYFTISWTDFLKLLDAKKVEYRLGPYEFKLKSKVLKEMQSFKNEVLK